MKTIIEASKEGRNAYIKAESFRILSALYNIQPPKDTNGDEDENMEDATVQSNTALQESIPAFAASLENALSDTDSELTKAKRVKDIVKSAERLVKFASTCYGNESVWNSLEKLQSPVQQLAEASGSNAVQTICKTLSTAIEDGMKLHKEKVLEEEEAKKNMMARMEEKEVPVTPSSSKKKKKKSKKKKGKK